MPINTPVLNLNSDMSVQAPVVSTNTENLGPNKWIVAGVAISAALAVNLTEQVKEDRFDLVSNVATVSAAAFAGGISYKLATDVEGVPTSVVATMAGSLGILSSVVVAPAVNVLGNKVKNHFSKVEEDQGILIVDNDAMEEYLEQKAEA